MDNNRSPHLEQLVTVEVERYEARLETLPFCIVWDVSARQASFTKRFAEERARLASAQRFCDVATAENQQRARRRNKRQRLHPMLRKKDLFQKARGSDSEHNRQHYLHLGQRQADTENAARLWVLFFLRCISPSG